MADDNIRNEFEELKADVHKLREDIAGLTEALRVAGSEKFSKAKESLDEEYMRRRENLRNSLKYAQGRGGEMFDDLEQEISRHPLGSLSMAFGMGFIFGRLLDGGRH